MLETVAAGGEYVEGEEEDVTEGEMEDAYALNEQLKAMLAMHEAEALRQQQLAQQRQPPRQQQSRPPQRRPAQQNVAAQQNAGRGGWGGKTHTDLQQAAIARENRILVEKMSKIAFSSSGGPNPVSKPPTGPKRASSSINRQRMNDQIARENAALAKRLASSKPTIAPGKKGPGAPPRRAPPVR